MFRNWDMYAYRARVAHDAIGAIVHPIAAALLLNTQDNSTTAILLIAQEIVAFVAHVIYCLWHAQLEFIAVRAGKASGKRNSMKWLEYAISATLGTLAVLYAREGNEDWWWVLLLCSTCASQQLIGYTLDQPNQSKKNQWANFFIAWLLQICEFLVIVFADDNVSSTEARYSLRVVYIIAWSLFGVLAFIDLLQDADTRFSASWNDTIEAMYACLSWTSKLSVVTLSVYPKWYVAALVLLFGKGTAIATWLLIRQHNRNQDSNNRLFA